MASIRQLITISINSAPFVRRSKYIEALEALERSNQENRKAIASLFETAQRHQRELLLSEKKRLEDLAHCLDIYAGERCDIGGISFRSRL